MSDESIDGFAFAPGVGAAINCYFPLVNVQGSDYETMHDAAGMHRSKDPGAGAFTYYHNRYSYATRDIAVGEELFTDYGENYFINNPDDYGMVPLHSSYEEADKLLRKYVRAQRTVCDVTRPSTQSPSTFDSCSIHDDWYSLLMDLRQVWSSRTLNALPEDAEVVEEIAHIGTSQTHYNRSIHTVDWLEDNGYCMDHLVAGPSTIPQAGRGAFARRFLPAGSVIAPAPVAHLNRDVLNMYSLRFTSSGWWGDRSAPPVHQQLLMNYCFGSNHTSVMLCPYGMLSSLINHGSTSSGTGNTGENDVASHPTCSNARIEWNHKMMKNPEWMTMPPEQWLDKEGHVGLAISYVALRDIRPGEEVLIDYGPDWVAAWNRHIEAWTPPPGSSRYVASYDMNDGPDSVVRTDAEGSYSASEMEIHCFDWYRQASGQDDDDGEVEKHPCRAKLRTVRGDGEHRYVVELYRRSHGAAIVGEDDESEEDSADDDEDEAVDEDGAARGSYVCTEALFDVLFDVPRDAFWFTDAYYSRDAMQPWSFRYPMGMPNDMLPRAWLS
jgi:hypothetical protein